MSRTKTLRLKDLENKQTFKNWIKEGLEDFYKEKEVPESDLIIFLDNLIERQAFETRDDGIDRVEWLKRIREIKENIKTVERYNKEESPVEEPPQV